MSVTLTYTSETFVLNETFVWNKGPIYNRITSIKRHGSECINFAAEID